MSAPSWQDGHVLWRADDPTLARLSVFDLCARYFFHGDPDGPVCHRVAALAPDEDDPRALKCAAIVSMSDVVRLLHDELFAGGGWRSSAAFAATREDAEEAASLAERVSLDDLGLAASAFAPLVFVDADAPAIRAFEAMTRSGVAFCAAVDERAGEIVANVSASDARGVLPDRIAALSLPLGDFLARAIDSHPGAASSSRGGAGGTSRTPSSSSRAARAPLFVHRSSSLADAVRVLCDGEIHHAFVAEDCGGDAFVAEAAAARRARGGLAKADVVGAVTLADVLRRACFEDAYDAAEG
jgi:CBS domain-containing protein